MRIFEIGVGEGSVTWNATTVRMLKTLFSTNPPTPQSLPFMLIKDNKNVCWESKMIAKFIASSAVASIQSGLLGQIRR